MRVKKRIVMAALLIVVVPTLGILMYWILVEGGTL